MFKVQGLGFGVCLRHSETGFTCKGGCLKKQGLASCDPCRKKSGAWRCQEALL